jgi:hypothetical protein
MEMFRAIGERQKTSRIQSSNYAMPIQFMTSRVEHIAGAGVDLRPSATWKRPAKCRRLQEQQRTLER